MPTEEVDEDAEHALRVAHGGIGDGLVHAALVLGALRELHILLHARERHWRVGLLQLPQVVVELVEARHEGQSAQVHGRARREQRRRRHQ